MAAPDYVPTEPQANVRAYRSPDHVPDSWLADRPADLGAFQPRAKGLGYQGPDLGYVLTLVDRFDDRISLSPGERRDDCDAGCTAVAMRRASLFGRAPVIGDLEIGYRVWGYLDQAPPDLVALRRELFERVAHPHHYQQRRRIADSVRDTTLAMAQAAVAQAHRQDWRALLDLG